MRITMFPFIFSAFLFTCSEDSPGPVPVELAEDVSDGSGLDSGLDDDTSTPDEEGSSEGSGDPEEGSATPVP